jgi:hypothetical protein
MQKYTEQKQQIPPNLPKSLTKTKTRLPNTRVHLAMDNRKPVITLERILERSFPSEELIFFRQKATLIIIFITMPF